MTDHAALLRQIRTDARPYIEQALDLAEVFTGFRKLASENGLDWGVIKALIKAEVQDEREGGSEKVERIITKADFASAYADMLGLGTKMNENNNFSSGSLTDKVSIELPPHDGVLIEEPDTSIAIPAEQGVSTLDPARPSARQAPGRLSNEAAPASGDVVESPSALAIKSARAAERLGTSPTISPASASPSEANAAIDPASSPAGLIAAPFELEDIPPGLDRRSKAA